MLSKEQMEALSKMFGMSSAELQAQLSSEYVEQGSFQFLKLEEDLGPSWVIQEGIAVFETAMYVATCIAVDNSPEGPQWTFGRKVR